MKYIKIGIIGAGYIGELHVRVCSEINDVKLLAIAEINEERGKEVAKKYNTKWYKDYNDMLKKEDIDAVIIATPEHLHLDPAIAAAEAGKHMLIEKPLATNVKDAEEIIKYAKKNGVKLMVGFIERFNPIFLTIKQAIVDGNIGAPILLYTKRINPLFIGERVGSRTNTLWWSGIHDIDLMHWFLEDDVYRVYAEGKKIVNDNEGLISALINFKSGALGVMICGWINPNNFPSRIDSRVEIFGDKGRIHASIPSDCTLISQNDVRNFDVFHWMDIRDETYGALKREIENFVECIIENKEPVVSGNDGLIATKVGVAILESIKEKKPITFSNF
ncbi:MAG: Gfo/Idh/MocA family oxidoreductase [Candidatus Aenigmatarchaeota archaeon]